MRANRPTLVIFSSWILLILWVEGLTLSAVPERATASDQFSVAFQQEAVSGTFESLEVMPVLMAQDWRHTVSVRPESSSTHAKHDLKKFHAALAAPTPALAASSLPMPQGIFTMPVPESWYGFSFSSRAPPLAV